MFFYSGDSIIFQKQNGNGKIKSEAIVKIKPGETIVIKGKDGKTRAIVTSGKEFIDEGNRKI